MNRVEPETCTLRRIARGATEICPRERCVFWEPGGAVLEGGCVVDRLHLDVRRDDLAEYLLEARERLELSKGGTR
jgi:hypothetical protein